MDKFEHEDMHTEREQTATVGSTPAQQIVALWVDNDGDCGCAEMKPAEARVLAALLLKHADRAEGRGT